MNIITCFRCFNVVLCKTNLFKTITKYDAYKLKVGLMNFDEYAPLHMPVPATCTRSTTTPAATRSALERNSARLRNCHYTTVLLYNGSCVNGLSCIQERFLFPDEEVRLTDSASRLLIYDLWNVADNMFIWRNVAPTSPLALVLTTY